MAPLVVKRSDPVPERFTRSVFVAGADGAAWEGEGSGFEDPPLQLTPPAWFDPANAGESWDGD